MPIAIAKQSNTNQNDRNIYRIANSDHLTVTSQSVQTLAPLLSKTDEKRYRRVFELQKSGNLSVAKNIIQQLDNNILIGHVLAQKYLDRY